MTIKVDEHGLTVQASRPALSQTLSIGAGSIASNAFSVGPTNSYTQAGTPITTPNNTLHVRLVATADCWISFGTAPVAVASGIACILLPAGIPEYFWVFPGEKVAVIQNVGAGSLNIGEMVA